MGKIFVNDEGDFESKPKEKADAFLESIKSHILENYRPVTQPHEADTRMTTMEIHDSIHQLYPGADFSAEMISTWLHEKGFTFFDAGKMRFEWLFKTTS